MWFRRTKASPNSYRVPIKEPQTGDVHVCICVSVFVLFVCSTKSEQNHSRTIQDGLKLCSLHASLPQANSSVLSTRGNSPWLERPHCWHDSVPAAHAHLLVLRNSRRWRHFLLGCVTLVMVLCCHRYHLAAKKSQHSCVLPEHVHGTVHRRRSRGISGPGVEPMLTVRLEKQDPCSQCWNDTMNRFLLQDT